MIRRSWPLRGGLLAGLLLVPGLLWAAHHRGRPARGASPLVTNAEAVDMFQAMDQGKIDVKFIPKNAKAATVIIANKLNKPLSIRLPEAFAGVPVLAQRNGGAGGGRLGGGGNLGGSSSTSSSSQGMGGGFGGGMGGGMGMGGGFFNVAPEQVGKLKVACLCLDHGKPDPAPRIKYEIKPIDQYVDRPAVIELVKAFGRGQLQYAAAQAAVWHLNNDVSWQVLAAKRKGPTRRFGPNPPYFNPAELRLAVGIAAECARRARVAAQYRASASAGTN